MQKQPVVNSKSLIRLLNNLGYQVVRQKGSHVRLTKVSEKGIHKITVPNHEEIAKGTLNDILNKISLWNDISKNELIIMLKEK